MCPFDRQHAATPGIPPAVQPGIAAGPFHCGSPGTIPPRLLDSAITETRLRTKADLALNAIHPLTIEYISKNQGLHLSGETGCMRTLTNALPLVNAKHPAIRDPLGLALHLSGVFPAFGPSPRLPVEVIAQNVEIAFRDAMEPWAYSEFWRLWEISSEESRFSHIQNDFAARWRGAVPGRSSDRLSSPMKTGDGARSSRISSVSPPILPRAAPLRSRHRHRTLRFRPYAPAAKAEYPAAGPRGAKIIAPAFWSLRSQRHGGKRNFLMAPCKPSKIFCRERLPPLLPAAVTTGLAHG